MIYKLEAALIEVQKETSKTWTELVTDIDDNTDIQKEQLITYIEKYINDNNIEVVDFEESKDLAEYLYKEMAGFSILDDYLYDKNVEEINVLSWKDIKITYNTGEIITAKRHFLSEQHNINIMTKLLSKSGMTLNKAKPIQVGYLQGNQNVRITAYNDEVNEKGLGVGASIRIINPKKLNVENFIDMDECNDEMINFLILAFRYGMSMCFTGETGSGKTTLMSSIMEKSVPDNKRLITMEENTREYNLHKFDENGFMINNVIHLTTRKSKDEDQNITLQELIKTALTLDPNYMCINEMKSAESYQAISAANTGHAVITTIHASSCYDTYYRMLSLTKENIKNDISTETLMDMICKAFPIVIFIKKYADNKRRISEITECTGFDTNKKEIQIKTLYKFNVEENIRNEETGKIEVIGAFEKINKPSNKTKDIFFQNGADIQTINKYF